MLSSRRRIKKITRKIFDSPIPVYDIIDSEPHHNFLTLGNKGYLVVHNSALLDENCLLWA